MKLQKQPEFADFYLPFDGKLDPENRWFKLAELVPWELVEERYAAALAGSEVGASPPLVRVAFGASIINLKTRMGAAARWAARIRPGAPPASAALPRTTAAYLPGR